jgi:hypothetical protein
MVMLSFEALWNALIAFTPIRESSFELSFVCCNVILNSPILVENALYISLVPAITLSAELLTTDPYVSVTPFGDIDQ